MVSSGCVARGSGRARRSTRGGLVCSPRARGPRPARRGPTPALSDAQLLAAIRTDLARSPFQGEGHRKVHARLRILDRIRVSRTRVLRVMRAHGLLSPHRGRQGDPKAHDGTIVTSAPQVMWGTDGVRVFTAEDGWVWTFAAVDHWNAECVGWHVCKVGSRFAALEPIAQGLGRLYGSVEADVARGLALRMDHGSQYLSDHSSTRSATGASTPASASSKSRKPTGSSSAGIARSRSKRSTAGSFTTSPKYAPPSPRSSNATTSAGALRSSPIARHSKRARSTSYVKPRSANVCPRNRVRYRRTSWSSLLPHPGARPLRTAKHGRTSTWSSTGMASRNSWPLSASVFVGARASSACSSTRRKYLFLGDYKYWTMTECPDIDLAVSDAVLNRALLYRDRRDFVIREGDTGKREG